MSVSKRERKRIQGLSRQVSKALRMAKCPNCGDEIPVFVNGDYRLVCSNGHEFEHKEAQA